jgi:hypothetical protein
MEPPDLMQPQGRRADVVAQQERIKLLLQVLREDLKHDISGVSIQEFTARVDQQFQYFEEIASLRARISDSESKEKRLLLTDVYKQFIQEIPSFKAAAEIKKNLSCDSALHQISLPCFWVEEREILGPGFIEVNWSFSRANEELLKTLISGLASLRKAYIDKKDKYKNGETDVSFESLVAAKKEWKEVWGGVQKALLEGYQRARPLVPRAFPRQITWLTGTSTATLVSMLRMQIPGLNGPALVPTGDLIRYNIPPLTGELFCGIQDNGINVTCVSGCTLQGTRTVKRYADSMKKEGLFRIADEIQIITEYTKFQLQSKPSVVSINRVKISVMRLLFARAQGAPRVDETLKIAKNNLQNLYDHMPSDSPQSANLFLLIGKEVDRKLPVHPIDEQSAKAGMIVKLEDRVSSQYGMISEIRNGMCFVTVEPVKKMFGYPPSSLGSYTDEDLGKVYDVYSKQLHAPPTEVPPLLKTLRARIGDLIGLIDDTERYPKITDKECSLIRDPSGIIFGSFTLADKDFHSVHSDFRCEVAVEGPQKLGKDIQVVFVEDKDIQRIREYLEKLPYQSQIHVIGMKALNYLTAVQKNSQF